MPPAWNKGVVMAITKNTAEQVADVLINEIGRNKAIEVINKLRKEVTGGSKSFKVTIQRIYDYLSL